MGPSQSPFSEDVALQRLGRASPFRMTNVPVEANDAIHFQDVAPLHVGSEASLEALRGAIAEEAEGSAAVTTEQEEQLSRFSIAHFRPNVVVAGGALRPWEEEEWERFSIQPTERDSSRAASSFRLLKGCPRCTVPARNPRSGEFFFGKEFSRLAPQRALRRLFPQKCRDDEWEREWEGPIFGIHVGLTLTGLESIDEQALPRTHFIRIGDVIQVERRRRHVNPIGQGWHFFGASLAILLAAVFVGALCVASPGAANAFIGRVVGGGSKADEAR